MTIRDQDYGCVVTTSNTAWNTTAGSYYYDESSPNINDWQYKSLCPSSWPPIKNNNKGDDNMRYLYEVILVNPKTDEFFTTKVVARSETSALMTAYQESEFSRGKIVEKFIEVNVPFDELKTNCKVLMEWKKEKSLEKALETIKKAIE